jgi:hypothetical protein
MSCGWFRIGDRSKRDFGAISGSPLRNLNGDA